MKQTEVIIILITVPDKQTANHLASILIENRLAACVNVIPGITSHFRWEGKVCSDSELMLIIKTRQSIFKIVEKLILDEHPYDVPEIIALNLTDGFPGYLNWVINETS